MIIKSMRKDKTAIKDENGKWHKCSPAVGNFVKWNGEYEVEDTGLVGTEEVITKVKLINSPKSNFQGSSVGDTPHSNSKEIIRQCCLKAAVELLKTENMSLQEKEDHVTRLINKWECCITSDYNTDIPEEIVK